MEEIIKKKQSSGWGGKREGAGRKPKNPSEVKRVKRPRGGKREGAGRKPKGEDALLGHVTFRTKAITLQRAQRLREITKQDEMNFNRMFEAWVEGMAKEYGIE